MSTSIDAAFLIQISLTCTESKSAFARQAGMSQTRVQLLMLLRHGETSHAALGQRLALDGATLTRQVKQFEAEGLVARRLDPADNRFTLVALTAQGEAAVAALEKSFMDFQARLLDGVSDADQTAALRVLAQVRSNMARQEDL